MAKAPVEGDLCRRLARFGRDGLERFNDRGAERGAAQVGVHDDACAIDDGQDARATQCVE